MRPAPRTLRALARLLGYPDPALRALLPALGPALRDEGALAPARLAALEALVAAIQAQAPLEAEAAYVELFDRGRATALHLFEHVHGDSRDRGPAMVDLVRTYEQAGLLLAPGELPDYLPVALEFASTQPPAAAHAFLGELAHIVRAIHGALAARGSPYAAVAAAVLDLAGESPGPAALADEPGLDEAWAEPAAFDGCANRGQDRPGQPRVVHVHPRPGAAPPQPGARP